MAGFLIDTNVVSDPTKRKPSAAVKAWFAGQDPVSLFIPTPVIGELYRGILRLAPGKRRTALTSWLEETLLPAFAGRVLSFDEAGAKQWGSLMAEGDRVGATRSAADALIAAIAVRYGLAVVTRNIQDFEGFGVDLVNPWETAEAG